MSGDNFADEEYSEYGVSRGRPVRRVHGRYRFAEDPS